MAKNADIGNFWHVFLPFLGPLQAINITYWGIYFYTFIPILGSEFQLEMPLNSIIINSKSEKLPLNKLSKCFSIDIFKMKNR